MSFKMDWCSHEAAKFACENWHYSGCMPAGKITKIGIWEKGKFIGCLLFSRGAAPDLVKRYGCRDQTEGCELTRIALTNHKVPVTKIISFAIKMLKKLSPGLKIIVSFADPREGHHGGVYQGSNWVYTGLSTQGGSLEYWINGKWTHHRSVGAKFGRAGKEFADSRGIKTRKPTRKHVYLYPLDEITKSRIMTLSKPYPKRVVSKDIVAKSHQDLEGGENPTTTLHSQNQEK